MKRKEFPVVRRFKAGDTLPLAEKRDCVKWNARPELAINESNMSDKTNLANTPIEIWIRDTTFDKYDFHTGDLLHYDFGMVNGDARDCHSIRPITM